MRNQKGFTLIELLVVIAIIGLLSTLAVISLNNARQKSRDSKRVADVKQIQTALELYYNDKNGYPATFNINNGGCLSDASGFAASGCTGTTYMSAVPAAPSPNDGTCTVAENYYSYTITGGAPYTTYSLTYCLGALTGGVAAGAHTATPAGIQ